jgi:hypothetical protein
MRSLVPSRTHRTRGSGHRASLTVALLSILLSTVPAYAAVWTYHLRQTLPIRPYIEQFHGGGSSARQTLRCQDPRPDGSATCELLGAGGKVLARGTLKRQGRPTGDSAAEAKLLAETFRNPATRATSVAKGRDTELRIAAPGSGPVFVALLLPAIQVAREAARRAPTAQPSQPSMAVEELHTQHEGLASPRAPARSGRVYTPAKGGNNAFAAPQSQEHLGLQRLGPIPTAKVPMKQGSCGLDCGTWVVANPHGNFDVPFRITLACAPGKTAVYAAYRIQGQFLEKVLHTDSGAGTFSKQLELRPFSTSELQAACLKALGGNWPLPNFPNNTSSTANTHLDKEISYWGRCSTETTNTSGQLHLSIPVVCQTPKTVQPVP